MAKRYVTCPNPSCSTRNDRTGGRRKCVSCATELPKVRVTAHKRKLRDVGYAEWERISDVIHGTVWEYGACGVCGRMPIGNRHDRDHDHDTGEIRGLACTGDFGCNRMMPRKLNYARAIEVAGLLHHDPVAAWALAPYLPRDLTPERADQIVDYLGRYERYYAAKRAAGDARLLEDLAL